MPTLAINPYVRDSEGIYVSQQTIQQRLDEYDDTGIDQLLDMQTRHFWYRGRHAFLLKHFLRLVRNYILNLSETRIVDMGGGCGGWVRYLASKFKVDVRELSLADSSRRALKLSYEHGVVSPDISRYQIDLMDLHWSNYWDFSFLLDVLEHVPDHVGAMRQVANATRPGGMIFVATPALKFFWSHNDELVHHVRRYSKDDMQKLAIESELELVDSRYFMFLLSPLLWLTRFRRPPIENMSADEIRQFQANTHRVPAAPVNAMLTGVFKCEVAMSNWVRYPYGTSIFAAFRKRG